MKTEKIAREADLVAVCVDGLFGQYNHRIRLLSDGLTLVHGPNGVGKTSLLKLIGFAITLDVDQLALLAFDRFSLSFSDGRHLTVTRSKSEPRPSHQSLFPDSEITIEREFATGLTFVLRGSDNTKHEWTISNTLPEEGKPSRIRQLRQLRESRPWLTRINPEQWLDERSHQILSTDEVLEQQSFGWSRKDRLGREKFLERIPKIPVQTIESQRLLVTGVHEHSASHRKQKETTNAVQFFVDQMSSKIGQTFLQSANVSQELDRTFAHRVLTSTENVDQSEHVLRDKYQKQLGTWTKIKDAGLLPELSEGMRNRFHRFGRPQGPEQLSLPENELDITQQRVLSCHLTDTQQKQEPYQSLLNQVELFLSIINSRFAYSGKELKCDAAEGFRVYARSGKKVPLELLSSGEQHEVVLNYQLIFGVQENSLVLIDEPEISLHIEWQREFIHQIRRIAEVRGHKFIVATHSPQIIDEHWDNTQVLGGALGDMNESDELN